MATIEKLSGVDVENFTRVDNVNKGDMLNIDNVEFGFPFVFTVNTANTQTGSSNSDQFHLPLTVGTQNFVVQWGDGTSDTITSASAPARLHTYPAAGTYTITILGDMEEWSQTLNTPNDELKYLSISRWGALGGVVFNRGSAFENCANLSSVTAPQGPALGTQPASFFTGCTSLDAGVMSNWNVSPCTRLPDWDSTVNPSPDLNSWDTSSCTSLASYFSGNRNALCDQWDTSSVTSLQSMCNNNAIFNQPIGNWDVSSVTNCSLVFRNAAASRAIDLSNWDPRSVTTFWYMFGLAGSYTGGDLGEWDVSNCNRFQDMFNGGVPSILNFNTKEVTKHGRTYLAWDIRSATNLSGMRVGGDCSNWDTSNVTNMGSWAGAALTADIETKLVTVGTTAARTYVAWDVSLCTNFSGACKFIENYACSKWQIPTSLGNVNMSGMFNSARIFNGDINTKQATVNSVTYIAWDTEAVTNMYNFWGSANAFNTPIDKWNVSNVASFEQFFLVTSGGSVYDQPMNTQEVTVGSKTYIAWRPSSCTNFYRMFYGCASFNQSLSNWDTSSATNMGSMFQNCSVFNSSLATQSVTVGTISPVTYTAWDVSGVTNMSAMFSSSGFANTSPSTWNLNSITDLATWYSGATDANLETILYAWSLNSNTNSGPAGTVNATNIGGTGARTYSAGSNMDLALNDPTNGLVAAKGWNITGINIV